MNYFNVADAIDKLRFAALSDEMWRGKPDPEIFIDFSEKAKPLLSEIAGRMSANEARKSERLQVLHETVFKDLEKGEQKTSELTGQFKLDFIHVALKWLKIH